MLRSFSILCRANSNRGLGSVSRYVRLSSSSDKSVLTVTDLAAEIKRLQQLVQEMQSLQSRNLEHLAQQVNSQTQNTERRLSDMIHSEVKGGGSALVDQISDAAKEYVQHNEAIKKLVEQVHRHPKLINKYTIGGLLASIVLVWRYWASIQKRTSKEVADLASKTLEQETLRQSIRETIDALANSPETLKTLTGLLQSLIQEPTTQQHLTNLIVHAANTEEVQKALMDILQNIFRDPSLQELSGEFLLKGLDVEHVKKMLDEQTQSLVKRTVSDDSVQRATGEGVRKSLRYAFNPFW